jgi:hypothetical protein
LLRVLSVVVALGVVSCSDQPSGRIGVAYDLTLRCDDAIEYVEAVPKEYGIIGDAAALPTAQSASLALQTSEHGSWDRASRLFAKSGLLVRVDRPFELVVPEAFHDRVALAWGNSGALTHRLMVPACPAEAGWLAFAGGIAVADPECITLEVVTESGVETFKMGVGEACPGQDSAPYPSDT